MPLALLLVLLNGFFVAAEFAIVKLRLTQAEDLVKATGLRGVVLLKVRRNLDAFLSACQLGITLASLGLGWIGEPAFARVIEPLLRTLGMKNADAVEGITIAVSFAAISFLHIVLGELAPKSIAIRKPEATSLFSAIPLYLFFWVMYPFIRGLNASANLALRLAGVESANKSEEVHSRDEIRKVLLAGRRHGSLRGEEAESVTRVLDLQDLVVGDLMMPAIDLVMLDINDTIQDNLKLVDETRYSRYPVMDGDRMRVIGYVHIKDLYSQLRRRVDIDLRAIMRPITFAHRDGSGFKLFETLRAGQSRLALVTDNLGRYVGFVTLAHILETVHGRIPDEFQHATDEWKHVGDNVYEGSGALPIYSLERIAGFEFDLEDPGVDSIAGMVAAKLDRIPVTGDRAAFAGMDIEVIEIDGNRVKKVRVTMKPARLAKREGG